MESKELTPPTSGSSAVTRLLKRYSGGDRAAFDELLPLVYDDLRRIAHGQRRRNSCRSTLLNTTALVHEAYLKLARREEVVCQHRGSFFAVAAVAMRHILVDHARSVLRDKRGGGVRPLDLDGRDICVDSQAEMLVALDAALSRLGQRNERLRQIVEWRFFGGLTEEETASLLDVTPRTVRRDWAKAKAWLAVDLGW